MKDPLRKYIYMEKKIILLPAVVCETPLKIIWPEAQMAELKEMQDSGGGSQGSHTSLDP